MNSDDLHADDSILRLDTDTTVTLSTGQNDSGQSVAQAILSDGRLWGRILTSTGVNLGGGGIVAGVRGTSVSVEKNAWIYTLAVIDSLSGTQAAKIMNTSQYIWTASRITYSSWASPTTLTPNPLGKIYLLADTWIQSNTRKDIDYLYTNSGSNRRIQDEYTVTVPSSVDLSTQDALCGDENGGIVKKVYWKSLIGTNQDKCQKETLIAFADYSKGNDLYFSQVDKIIKATTASTNVITEIWKYIQYQNNTTAAWTNSFTGFSWLAGKTMTINLAGSVGSQQKDTSQTKFYVADFGTSRVFKNASNQFQLQICPIGQASCNAATNLAIESNTKTISIEIPATPTQMIIWNQWYDWSSTYYSKPIWTTIQSITIE